MNGGMICKHFLWGSLFLFFSASPVFAADEGVPVTHVNAVQQNGRTVTVTVSDKAGAIIGANVIVKGTTNGNITDTNGKATIQNVPTNATLVVSYIGYISQEIPAGRGNIKVTLVENTQNLNEVVVVGYGTQAKKDITGSVAVVSSEALTETPVATFAEALQGKASGVYISSTGAPGSETTIRIRGVGSVNGSDPLIVVDGVSNVSIDAVNPNDIESLQVLKDASATAIYGAQGANGVIIITTKQGTKSGTVRVSYDGYVGAAKMANSGYDLLNAWEAMEFQAQGLVNLRDVRGVTSSHQQFGSLDANDQLTMPYATNPAGYSEQQIIDRFGSVAAWEAAYKPDGTHSYARSAYYQMLKDGYSEAEARKGTDWYSLVKRTGLVQEHQLSVLGGNDKGTYSMAVGYMSREGTLKSSFFDRYSLRVNANYNVNKWLSIGENTNLAAMQMNGERGRQGDGNTFGKVYTTQPWIPIYNIGGDYAGSQSNGGGRNTSPVQYTDQMKNDWTKMFRGQTAVYAEVKPITDLKVRSQFSASLMGFWNSDFSPITIYADKEGTSQNTFSETADWRLNWQWTNTATYTKKFNEDHNLTVVLGMEAMKQNLGRDISGTRYNYIFENNPNTWILNNGGSANQSNSGYAQSKTTMYGLFGRADYSYQGKYLVTATVRRDGASKFGSNNRWGTFPSISLGWRISDEAFMASQKKWMDDLKLRAGYGTTGNSNIGAYNYAFQYATGNSYLYGRTGSNAASTAGYAISNLGDVNAKWETTKMFNVGFDLTAFSNRLTATFDYYVKKTSDMLVAANWSALAGNATKPNINIGDMQNKGVDLSLGWRDKIGKVSFNINGNVSTYKNKVIKLGSSDIFNSTRLDRINITTEGQPIGMFYGFKVEGIYKSESDVTGFTNDNGQTVLPYAVTDAAKLNPKDWVGRYKIKDVNNDGKINTADRTIIGNPHPDFTGGLNLSASWNGFDLGTYLYFSVGNDLFRHYMYYTYYGALQSNYSKDRRDNSWSPSNPNGKYPLWATTSGEGTEAANESNSMYVQDGSYLRMQTLTFGYTIPKKLLSKIKFESIRLYGQVSNVFTITGYDGLDPEVRSDDGYGNSTDYNKGIDYGSYGMPRQFIFGLHVQF
jgi:TonB-linked SusC/RagA family outer membrane protein